MTDEPVENEPVDIVAGIQNLLAAADPSAMLVGFAIVADWLEEDGERTMMVRHTPMPSWQLDGMLRYAAEECINDYESYVAYVIDDGEDEI